MIKFSNATKWGFASSFGRFDSFVTATEMIDLYPGSDIGNLLCHNLKNALNLGCHVFSCPHPGMLCLYAERGGRGGSISSLEYA